MTPQEFVQTQRLQGVRTIADNSNFLNYNQSCVSCHSTTELNERSEEMELYGIRTVHNGYSLSSRDWIVDTRPWPINDPTPNPFWPQTNNYRTSWWMSSAGTPVTQTPIEQHRTVGSTRDGSTERERSPSSNSPTYTQPQSPSGGSSPAPSPTATTVTKQSSTSPAASPGDSGRSREGNTTDTPSARTRNDGTSRDDSNNRPR